MSQHACTHQEAWLLLPWLANGRLAAPERDGLEEHVRECAACTQELARERRLCEALTEPDRVTYAPGPSLRKLLERIEGVPAASRPAAPRPAAPRPAAALRPHPSPRHARSPSAAVWRPASLAWAASLVLAIGLTAVAPTAYRWSQPRYVTHTDAARATPGVLHVAFDRSLPVGDLEEMLRAAGARVVEGPGPSGIFGVAPTAPAAQPGGSASARLSALAARLRADARVRWVEPLTAERESGGRTAGP